MEKVNRLKDYVPRHIRLGVCCDVPSLESFHDVIDEIPIVDASGNVIELRKSIKRVPAVEAMSAYDVDKFRLSAMVKAGVPLSVVNINHSNTFTIEQLHEICQNLDSAESYVAKVAQQQKERESWFSEIEENNNVELNEIY